MFPLDIAIWERFLDEFGRDYKGFEYDVKVGTGSIPEPETPENYARMEEILSKYRIDAVGIKPNQLEIIEVKPDASTTAIGQVTTYLNLYKRDFAPTIPIRGVIVTDREIGDIVHLTKELDFDYYIV